MTTGKKTPVTAAKNKEAVIRRDMRVRDIQVLLPTAEDCMAQYGLHCAGCGVGGEETLEDGCRMHGMSEADIDDLLTDLNILLSERPARPAMLTLTEAAAIALKKMIDDEGKSGWGLTVGTDVGGAFSMEFREKPDVNDKIFYNETVPEVRLFASSVTLAGIGGATIDLRDGRFKLDLPEDTKKAGCACGGKCECKTN